MTKRKKKKNTLKTNIKFEIYGILILTLSIISLAGKSDTPGLGSVGRAFSHIFFFLAGSFYFIIPLCLIYVGLYAMMQRNWPQKWSYRKTGILLFIVALLFLNHIQLFEQLEPSSSEVSSITIMSQPFDNVSDYFGGEKDANAYKMHLGGGLIGGIVYGLMHFFFDAEGSRVLVYALFAIAIICFTGWSYIDMIRKIRIAYKKIRDAVVQKWNLRQKKGTRPKRLPSEPAVKEQPMNAENGERKKSIFNLLQKHDVVPVNTNETVQRPVESESSETTRQEHTAEFSDDDSLAETTEETAEAALLITDFHDQLELTNETDDHIEATMGEEEILAQQTVESEVNSEFEANHDAEAPDQDEKKKTPNDTINIKLTDSKEEPVPYELPPFHLLSKQKVSSGGKDLNYEENARKLEATLESFGVRARVAKVVRGPTVTRYEIQPDIGVKVSRIVSLTDDIALALAARDIRMEAPIPGKAAIGIEVPNTEVSIVTLREVLESSSFRESASKVTIGLGRDISGQPMIADLAKMPHMLVAGATGSGKSVCINGMICSILYKAEPHEVKFLMIDPKKVELNIYNGIPHLLAPVVTDPRRASLALRKIVQEMEKRYELFSDSGTRNIEGYNEYVRANESAEPLPYIVVIVDELADLMMVAAGDVEDAITRLAQMARAAGIHLIIATQRPSVNVITGVIKANIPSRIAFGVSSQIDSRTILDAAGAEKLLGRGDMLFQPVGASKPVRIQGAFLSDQEVEAIVTYVSDQAEVEYQEEIVPTLEEAALHEQDEEEDELYGQAVQVIIEAKQASVSLLQRRLRIGYTRAARLIDSLEARGVVGPYEGSKPREVLISEDPSSPDVVSS